MRCVAIFAALLLTSSCTAANANSDAKPKMSVRAPLTEEALRGLFLNGLNTYLTPPKTEVIETPSPFELFRPGGSYARGEGFITHEGTYGVEGNRICVEGKRIPRQCRKLIPQGVGVYLLIDVSDGSQAIMDLRQVK